AMECIDTDYLQQWLRTLLAIPSPSGYTDAIVRACCAELDRLGVPYEITRRGAIRARLQGQAAQPARAFSAHVDTLGAQVKLLKPNGRLELVPIGHWSSRFAEGARVTVYGDEQRYRGTILPCKSSGHTWSDAVDSQPVAWTNVELRLDERVRTREDVLALGVSIGDTVSIDSNPEILDNGFVKARHLDDKAGVAAMLAAAKAIREQRVSLPVDCHFLFTISEEVGVGASHVLHGDVAELVSI